MTLPSKGKRRFGRRATWCTVTAKIRDRLESASPTCRWEHAMWDAFISYASEDRAELALPIAKSLESSGLAVWFDQFQLEVGDSLSRTIDAGLAASRFGIVILSKAFFQKEWPRRELDGLMSRESNGQKVVLPIWHDLQMT